MNQVKDQRFTILLTRDDRKLIKKLASELRRTESDTVRFVVTEAAKQIESQKQGATNERS